MELISLTALFHFERLLSIAFLLFSHIISLLTFFSTCIFFHVLDKNGKKKSISISMHILVKKQCTRIIIIRIAYAFIYILKIICCNLYLRSFFIVFGAERTNYSKDMRKIWLLIAAMWTGTHCEPKNGNFFRLKVSFDQQIFICL